MGKIKILSFFLFIFLISFCLAQGVPFQTTAGASTEGFNIQVPTTIQDHQANTPYNFHIQVTNISNGVIITNSTASCDFHFTNSSGDHLFKQAMYFDPPYDFEINIAAGNFTSGCFDYDIYCNDSTVLAGQVEGGFCTSYTGKEMATSSAVFYIVLFGAFIFMFFALVFAIGKLPDENSRDEEGKILNINYLKYLRPPLWFIAWMLVVAMFYIMSSLSFGYLEDTLMANFFHTLFIITMGMSAPIVIVWFFWIFTRIGEDKEIKKLMERGANMGTV